MLLEGLIGQGLFSEKLPPIFSSESFYNLLKKEFFDKGKPLPFNVRNGCDYVRYESVRNINVPRQLSIPNPFAYAKLCKIIADNWDKLKVFFKEKTKNHEFKISRIHIRKLTNTRCLFKMNYKNFFMDNDPTLNLLIGKRFVVKTDISNCFPSIYSHSIPWAIKGRGVSKNNKNHWSDKIDEAVRLIKYKESDGLLIGPHVSNLISEIILCTVDDELYKKGYHFIRNIDDYECFVETFEKGEKFLLDLSKELRKYNLSLNLKKTTLTELPLTTVENWISQLNSHILILEKDKVKSPFLRNFWNFVVNLFKDNNYNSAILNYAIKMISTKKLNKYALEYHLKTVHHLVLLYPYLVGLLDEFLFTPFVQNEVSIIKTFANDIFRNGKAKNLFESMSYALFFALKYNFKIEEDDLFAIAEESKDAVLMLLCYLFDKKNNNSITKYERLAENIKGEGEEDKYWIFTYEVLSQAKLDGNYKFIKKEGISFVKDEYNA